MQKILLVNSNRIHPPVGPIGLDYIGASILQAGYEIDLIDFSIEKDPDSAVKRYFATAHREPLLAGITFRNVDDCFWPQAQSFVHELTAIVSQLKEANNGPVLLGGSGYSLFPKRLLETTGADFGVYGDGEAAVVSLIQTLEQKKDLFHKIGGLVYRANGSIKSNPPAWPRTVSVPASRPLIDNRYYFTNGGQAGLETKRGCSRKCIYCIDPLIKGGLHRLRDPVEAADEAQTLLSEGIDVLHLCDPEFNLPRRHALSVCREFIRRRLGSRLRWYAYLAVEPFDRELASLMQQSGCAGINFTTDSADISMLKTYRQVHTPEAITQAVSLAKEHKIKVMLDLLIGGPGETPETVADSIRHLKATEADCIGTSYGIRIHPGTAMETIVRAEGDPARNPNIRRHYQGPIDLLQPTYYIARELGDTPAALIREHISDDERFFLPTDDRVSGEDHNYSDNSALQEAIRAGERGAFWDILRRMRSGPDS